MWKKVMTIDIFQLLLLIYDQQKYNCSLEILKSRTLDHTHEIETVEILKICQSQTSLM